VRRLIAIVGVLVAFAVLVGLSLFPLVRRALER